MTRDEIKREKYLDKRVSMPYMEMRQAIIRWCEAKSTLNIDEFTENYK